MTEGKEKLFYVQIGQSDSRSIMRHLNAGWDYYPIPALELNSGMLLFRKAMPEGTKIQTYSIYGVPKPAGDYYNQLTYMIEQSKDKTLVADYEKQISEFHHETDYAYSVFPSSHFYHAQMASMMDNIDKMQDVVMLSKHEFHEKTDPGVYLRNGGMTFDIQSADKDKVIAINSLEGKALYNFGLNSEGLVYGAYESPCILENLKGLKTFKTGIDTEKEALENMEMLHNLDDGFIHFAVTCQAL